MPRKRRPGRPKKYTYKKKIKEPYQASWEKAFSFNISPEALRSIFGIILIAFSLLLILSFVNLSGILGIRLFNVLTFLIGWTIYLLAPLSLALGIALFFPERFPVIKNTIFGMILFLVFTSGLMHLPFIGRVIKDRWGGGKVGFLIDNFALSFLSPIALAIILIALMAISLTIATNVSLRDIFNFLKNLFKKEKAPELNINTVNQPEVEPLKTKGLSEKPVKQDEFKITPPPLGNWKLPSLDILETITSPVDSGNIKQNANLIQKTLENFGVKVYMSDVNIGPTVTQYTLKPEEGIKLNKITNLDKDLALALAAHPIRIEAPIPGKSLVGIEVPNKKRALVRLKPILESVAFKNMGSHLKIALGLDVAGQTQATDIEKMPHLLIAGATGSGKSVCINSILLSLLFQNSPENLRFILVDPKRVELTHYDGLPHLLSPVITEPEKTVSALKWVVAEMERRYHLFQETKKRNVQEYNQIYSKERLPFILVIIDELADLMAIAASEVEALICRLAQMARATGIHLIVATQRPSVDVITGLIKANITTRIAFSVASQIDSRTILDQAGAEKLLGMGDMLYVSAEISKPKRIQGVYISEKEIKGVANFIKNQGTPQYEEEVLTQPVKQSGYFETPDDDLFLDACNVVIQSGKASASLLQRRLRIGYARAARLLDLLEERGVIGPYDGARPRQVLISDVSEVMEEEGE